VRVTAPLVFSLACNGVTAIKSDQWAVTLLTSDHQKVSAVLVALACFILRANPALFHLAILVTAITRPRVAIITILSVI